MADDQQEQQPMPKSPSTSTITANSNETDDKQKTRRKQEITPRKYSRSVSSSSVESCSSVNDSVTKRPRLIGRKVETINLSSSSESDPDVDVNVTDLECFSETVKTAGHTPNKSQPTSSGTNGNGTMEQNPPAPEPAAPAKLPPPPLTRHVIKIIRAPTHTPKNNRPSWSVLSPLSKSGTSSGVKQLYYNPLHNKFAQVQHCDTDPSIPGSTNTGGSSGASSTAVSAARSLSNSPSTIKPLQTSGSGIASMPNGASAPTELSASPSAKESSIRIGDLDKITCSPDAISVATVTAYPSPLSGVSPQAETADEWMDVGQSNSHTPLATNPPTPVSSSTVPSTATGSSTVTVSNPVPEIKMEVSVGTQIVPLDVTTPLPLITYTEQDRRNRKYLDLLLCTCASPSMHDDNGDVFGHRIILEQIPYIRQNVTADSIEADVIHLPGLNPAAVDMIVSMYYTRVLRLRDNCTFEDLFTAAEKLGVSNLVNSFTLKQSAARMNNSEFLNQIESYFLKNLSTQLENPLISTCPLTQFLQYFREGVQLSVPHAILLKAIVHWAGGDLRNRTGQLFGLVSQLDLGRIFDTSPRMLRQVFAPDSVLASVPDCVQLHNRVLAEKAYELLDSSTNSRLETLDETLNVKAEPEMGSVSRSFTTETTALLRVKVERELASSTLTSTTSVPALFEGSSDGRSVELTKPKLPLITASSITISPRTTSRTAVVLKPTATSVPIDQPNESSSSRSLEPRPIPTGPTLRIRPPPSTTPSPRASPTRTRTAAVLPQPQVVTKKPELDPPPQTSQESLIDQEMAAMHSNIETTIQEVSRSDSSSSEETTRVQPMVPVPERDVLLYHVTGGGDRHLEAFDFRNNSRHWLHSVKRERIRDFSCMAQIGKKIFEIGGGEGIHSSVWEEMCSSPLVDVYTQAKPAGKPGSNLSKKRRCFSVSVMDGCIYAIGGDMEDDEGIVRVTNVVEKLDAAKGQSRMVWKKDAYMNEARSCHASEVFNGYLYAAGGIGRSKAVGKPTDTQALKTMEMYNPREKLWVVVEPMMVGRRCFGLIAHRKRMYAIGGEDRHGRLIRSVEQYDSEGCQWEQVPMLNHARAGFGLFQMSGCIYVVGGTGVVEPTIEYYNPATNLWTEMEWPVDLTKSVRLFSSISISREYLAVQEGEEGLVGR